MSSGGYIDGPELTLTAGEALSQYRRVKLSGDRTVVYADAFDVAIGVTRETVANAAVVTVRLLGKEGTLPMVASGAITQNAPVYGANDGKISANAAGLPLGVALEAATADGDHIEILPRLSGLFFASPGQVPSRSVHGFFEDFDHFVTADRFTVTATDAGGAAVADGAGGIIAADCSDGSVADNDEVYVHQTTETFTVVANKPIFFEAYVQFTEANTDDANVMVGLAAVWAANHLQDNGAGPPASYDGIVFYKIDGGTTWAAEISVGAAQTAVTLTSTAAGGASYQRLSIYVVPTSSTAATAYFYINDTLVGSSAFTYTGMGAMEAGVGAKNGGANEEVLNVDYIACYQAR